MTTSINGSLLRRDFMALGGVTAAAMAMPVLAQPRTLRIGSTFDDSGAEKANGNGNFRGASAYFNAINKTGGIGGAKVELVMADDQFKPDIAKKNALAFQGDPSILAMLNPLGTRQTAAIMETVQDMAIVGPNTGTAGLHKSSPPNVFWIRASYDAEVEKLIRTAVTLGMTKIGIVYPKDPLGASVLAGFQKAMADVKLEPVILATTPGTASTEVEPAAQAIAKVQPQMVVMVLGGIAPLFLKALRAAGGTSTIYGLSISASPANITAMGDSGRGLGFAMVVPSPFATKNELVRRYQLDMAASGWSDYSTPTLEGYANARVLAEGLRRAGAKVTRASLITALDSITGFNLGGMTISFGNGNRNGGNFVDVGVLGAGGRLVS
ncbi:MULTISPECIES: ABC transporter substrate-binding protein [Polaromonas]|uniref:ABC transporter substrate-binding protein n=1 Tax=Polaromonas aquatica TaxID=332657 RepID=A0ABW1U509_9BURK